LTQLLGYTNNLIIYHIIAIVQEDKIISEINEQIESKNHGRLFAVIHIAGRQFKITEEDVIVIRGHWAPDIGDRLRLEKVFF